MKVLGIETSCDETGIAVYCSERGLLAHQVYSQVDMHAEYGGTVPELASRDHIRKALPLIKKVLADAGVKKADIDGVAYTAGPGLIGALLVGATLGGSLAYGWNIPAIGIHHMEAHLLAPMLEEEVPQFPFIALLVSGGHTLLVQVDGVGQYHTLGESVDDAVGEAFDKTARMLGLGYPGGPALARLAPKGRANFYKFPRPMVNRPGLEFSFSGLKTHAINCWQASEQDEQAKADIAWAFQDAAVDTLVIKCRRALKQTGLNQLVVAGGVSANLELRQRLGKIMKENNGKVFFPRHEFCSDNGAMVAYAGYLRLQAGQYETLSINVKPRWNMAELSAI